MKQKQAPKSVDLFGTFLKKGSKASQIPPVSETEQPADVILSILRAEGPTEVQDLLERLGGSVQINLNAIDMLERNGLVTRKSDDEGRVTLFAVGK